MEPHFFKYRGRRIRYFNRYLWFCYYGFFLLPFLILLGWFSWKVFYPRLSTYSNWQMYLIPGISIVLYLLLVSGLILGLMRWSRLKEGYFASVYWRQLLARMLIDNRFIYTKKQVGEKQTKEKMRLPKVYFYQKKQELVVSFPLDGGRFHERFLKMGNLLSEVFLRDLIREEREKARINYVFLSDSGRIPIDQCIAENGCIHLMKTLDWVYDQSPNLLISGAIGGGKTYLLYSLIKACLGVGTVDICDGKAADLAALGDVDVFKGHVFYKTNEEMIICLRNALKEMNQRYAYMKTMKEPKYEPGKNYAYYGISPHFIFFDEWAAFYGSLDMETRNKVDKLIQPVVLKGRQAGMYIILAMQRPDAEYFPSGVRDNLTFRISVGRLSPIGYLMTFGEDFKNKPFYNKDQPGRGYAFPGFDVPVEFFAPFVYKGYHFIEEFKKFETMIVQDFSVLKEEAFTSSEEQIVRQAQSLKRNTKTNGIDEESYTLL